MSDDARSHAPKAEIVLRWTNSEGNPFNYPISSPLPNSQIAAIQLSQVDGELEVCREETTGTKDTRNVIGRFQASPPHFFEPYVEGVTIEQAHHDQLSWCCDLDLLPSIRVPQSTDQEHFFVGLRPGDTINFGRHALRVRFDVQPLNRAPEVPAMASSGDGDEVQVKSSDAEADRQLDHRRVDEDGDENENDDHVASDAETEDESDLDVAPSTMPTARTPFVGGEDTPATSNPTLGEIKETPAAGRPTTRDSNQPFSTAPEHSEGPEVDGVTSSAVVLSDAFDHNSPLAKKTRESQDDEAMQLQSMATDIRTGAFINAPEEGSPEMPDARPDLPSEELGNDDIVLSKPVLQSKQRTHTTISLGTTTEDDDAAADGSDVSDNIDVGMPSTSDPLDEHAVVTKAAERSLPQRGTKRGRLPKAAMDDDDDHDDDVVAVPQKRARRGPAAKASSPAERKTDLVTYTKASSKLSKDTHSRIKTIEDDDEIAVAQPKSTRKTTKVTVVPSPSPAINGNTQLRRTPASSAASTAPNGKVPKVLLSRSALDTGTITWLKKQGTHVIDNVPTKRSHFLCVVPKDELATTAKILRTLALDKLVVTDDWVTDSKAHGALLAPDDYVHDALKESVEIQRSKLFVGRIVYFTKKLANDYGTTGWANIQALVKEAGASLVESGSAANGEKTSRMGDTVFFGSDGIDNDATALATEHHKVVYHKDMLTQSILRGELDLESEEFRLKDLARSGKKLGKKR